MFEVEHLIYNQWCSQYKSDKTLKTLEFLRNEQNYKENVWGWTLDIQSVVFTIQIR